MAMPLDPAALRAAEFPWMDTEPGAFLNAASVGPHPRRALAAAAHWSEARGRPHTIPFEALLEVAATARRQFAALVGAGADEIALMPNTTYGLNLAARGLPLRPGVVLTFDGEFPSCVYPFEALGSRGITLERVPRRDGLPDEDALVIPDLAGLDVFEAGSQLVDGVDVHASFVGESGPAHERGTGGHAGGWPTDPRSWKVRRAFLGCRRAGSFCRASVRGAGGRW